LSDAVYQQRLFINSGYLSTAVIYQQRLFIKSGHLANEAMKKGA
jgi:hypothetical protein